MSMHKKPLTPLEEKGLRLHGLDIGKPSQLSDVFRHGVAWAISQDPEKTACEALRARLAKYEDADGRPLQHGCVVLPERWSVPRPIWKDVRQPYGDPLNHADIEAAKKFNLALDEVARLNSSPVSAGDDRETIRAVFLRNGFTIKEGQADLKPYVYAAADELMSIARAALSAPSHGEQVREAAPEPVRDALARRCLWLAFCWNDHNFGPAHEEARKEALKHGIDSFDAANEWLAAAPSAGSQEKGE